MCKIDDLRKRLYDRTLSFPERNKARTELKLIALSLHKPVEYKGVLFYVVVRQDLSGRKYYEDILSGLKLYQIYAIRDAVTQIEYAEIELGLRPIKVTEYEPL